VARINIQSRHLEDLEELVELDELQEELEQAEEALKVQLGPGWRVTVQVNIRPFPSRKPDE
jgi:hypothetical protein